MKRNSQPIASWIFISVLISCALFIARIQLIDREFIERFCKNQNMIMGVRQRAGIVPLCQCLLPNDVSDEVRSPENFIAHYFEVMRLIVVDSDSKASRRPIGGGE